MKTIIGIDPGLSGAIAYLYEDGAAHIEDIPTVGGDIDGPNLSSLFYVLMRSLHGPAHVFLEKQQAIPGMGISSAATFKAGVIYGQIKQAAIDQGLPLTEIRAAEWKKYFRLKGGDKESARKRALELYPTLAGDLARKKDHNRAEALLIATYGKRKGV